LEKDLHELHELRARQQRLYDRAPCSEAQKAQEETTQKLKQTLDQIAAGKKLKRKNRKILGEQRGEAGRTAVFSVTSSPIKTQSQNLEVERVKKQYLKEDTAEDGLGQAPRSTDFVDYIYLEV